MFKTRRQRRYERLRQTGFFPLEAQVLSKVPFSVPYMDKLIMERYKRYSAAMARKMTRAAWEKQTHDIYRENKWIKRTRAGILKYDVWAMLRDFEDRYRAQNPEYESPWQARRKAWRDFVTKLEATYSKYPRRMPVPRLRYRPEGGAEIIA